jgi:hypothetical protein
MARLVLSSSTLEGSGVVNVSFALLPLFTIVKYEDRLLTGFICVVYSGSGCNGGTLGVSGGSCIEKGQWNSFRLS